MAEQDEPYGPPPQPGWAPPPQPGWGPPPPQPGWAPPQHQGWQPPGWAPPGWAPPGWAPPQAMHPAAPLHAPPHGPPPMPPVVQVRRPPYPHPEPRPYHLMYRTWTYAWWRPVVGILALAAGMVVVLPVLLLPVLLIGVALEQGEDGFGRAFERAISLEELTPSVLLYTNLSLAALTLWCWLLVRVLHQMRPRWLSSVLPKLRWRYLFACCGAAVVALVAQVVVGLLVPVSETDLDPAGASYTTTTLVLAVIVLLTTPLQSIGEEYAFRGYLMQAVGSLTRSTWAALVVTSTAFALAHGVQNFPLFFDRFMFGLVAGWLVIRTGGLEAGIAMHVLNNLVAFGFGLAFSDIDETLTVSSISWWNIPVTLTQSLVFAALALVLARRMGLEHRTAGPPPELEVGAGAPPQPVPAGR